jgi:antitoxin CptB
MEKSRIRWGCRRGILELDIMLCRFFDEQYDTLSPELQNDFVTLLTEEDQVLFRWLVGQFEPEDEKTKNIVQMIRETQEKNKH